MNGTNIDASPCGYFPKTMFSDFKPPAKATNQPFWMTCLANLQLGEKQRFSPDPTLCKGFAPAK
jgi:hypothetical protein